MEQPSKQRRGSQIDLATRTVIVQGPDAPVVYDLNTIPSSDAIAFLALVGLKTLVLAAERPWELYDGLRNGELPAHRKPVVKPVSKTRRAIAYAIAHALAVAQAPKGKKAVIDALTHEKLEQATETALALSVEEVDRLKRRDDVQEAWRVLFSKPIEGDGEVSLLEAIGAVQPMHQEVGLAPAHPGLTYEEACAL